MSPSESTLGPIALAHGTDKAPGAHSYTAIYENFLGDRRVEIRTLVELGVASGASLRMWRDWLPHARIVGLDRDAHSKDQGEGERIRVVTGEQTDPAAIAEVMALIRTWWSPHESNLAGPHDNNAPIDVVVDDCSHILSKTVESFRLLAPYMATGGLYFVEDCDFMGGAAAVIGEIDQVHAEHASTLIDMADYHGAPDTMAVFGFW